MRFLRVFITFITILIFISVIVPPFAAHAQDKVFTPETLSQFDGKNGHPAYFAYNGKVYDVTTSNLWQDGNHYGLHAGEDLTGKMTGAPHGEEVFAGFPVVGTFQSNPNSGEALVGPTAKPLSASVTTKHWYDAPIRIAGISILGWTGIFLGIFFVLNFATCFALPWSKTDLPWTGNRPGPDPLDASGIHMKWTMLHKYFAWATVIFGILHGVLGILQLFGLYL